MGIPTINIGIRQKGRERTSSIIDCKINKKKILDAIRKSQKTEFLKNNVTKESRKFLYKKNSSKKVYNKILDILKTKNHSKEFVDMIK